MRTPSLRIVLSICCLALAFEIPQAFADSYDEQAKALLNDLDDKEAPILPEIAKATANTQRDVFRSVAGEANDCMSYYYSLGFCVRNSTSDMPEGREKNTGTEFLQELKHDEEAMFAISVATTEAGALDRQTIKTAITSGIQDNAMRIHNDCGNMSLIATSSKTLFCKSLQHSPSDRLRYWLQHFNSDKYKGGQYPKD